MEKKKNLIKLPNNKNYFTSSRYQGFRRRKNLEGILLNFKEVKKNTEIELSLKFKGILPKREIFDKEYDLVYKKYQDLYCTTPSYQEPLVREKRKIYNDLKTVCKSQNKSKF